jgi:flagellar basal-body rod modification protein FlgD
MPTNVLSTGALSDLSIQQRQENQPESSNELGKDAFLKLLVTQMSNQDPLDPQSNSDFVAQLAQFSSVEGLGTLNATVEKMAASFQSSQALQATALVGRSIKVDSKSAQLTETGSVEGTINLPFNASRVDMNVYNAAGEIVAQRPIAVNNGEAAQFISAGELAFSWDGTDNKGNRLPRGSYRFEVLATSGKTVKQVGTSMNANVDSVTVGTNGSITLNVAGVGAIPMSSVREIL